MNPFDRLPQDAAEVFGEGATAAEAYGLLTVDVPAASWLTALRTARDELACGFFDWLSAVDEPGTGFRVSAHLADAGRGGVRHLLIRTTVPHDAPELPTAVEVFAGAAWHERETHEMFGIVFAGHPNLVPLLLPENFEGHPLRKDFVLAARVAKAWPGAKEPGESTADHGGAKRRQMLPPGVPDPNDWGPLKGQLPPAPARAARTGARPAAGEPGAASPGGSGPSRPARPARRSRSVSEGSASQQAQPPKTGEAQAPQTEGEEPKTAGEAQAPKTQGEAQAPQTEGEQGPPAGEWKPQTEGEEPKTGEGAPRAPRRRTDHAPWDRPAPPPEPGEDEGGER